MEGTVKWFNARKGFGFVAGEDGEDYFVHHSALKDMRFLRDNDKVKFDAADTDKGKQAQNVELLQKGSEIEGAEAPAKKSSEEQAPVEESSEDFGEEESVEEPTDEEDTE